MSDDEYVEGNDSSEPADTPVEDAGPKGQTIDSSSVTTDAPVLQNQRKTARTQSARKAFAEAVAANKKEAASKPPSEVDELDPEAPMVPEAKVPTEVTKEILAAKAAGAPKPAADVVAPPAPSLDPEVRKLREMLQADRDKLAVQLAELEKKSKAAEPAVLPDALSLENYVDSAPKAYRTWMESMRGEKFASDDEFKSEVSDFITAMSTEVLGVPLPDNIRAQFDAAQARKIVRTHKTIQTRKEAAAAAQAEKDRAAAQEKAEAAAVETEWRKAAEIIGRQFVPAQDAEGKPLPSAAAKAYPWLAVEDNPGEIVVDVVQSFMKKDGTQLSWQEAAKRANDFIATEKQKDYDKRKALLAAAQTPAKAAVVAKPVTPTLDQAAKAAIVPKGVAEPKKWSREKHLENTRAAFRAAVAGKQG